jgi:hypothetical protein
MTTISKNTPEHHNTNSQPEQSQWFHNFIAPARHFLLHFLELQIPMGFGALVCFLLIRLIPASSSFATIYYPGTYLFASGDILFLSIPVVMWMVLRGHEWQHSVEMGIAMIMPVAVIILLGWLSTVAYAYLLWLITAGYPTMCLGMFIYMLYRHNYFTRRIGWSG